MDFGLSEEQQLLQATLGRYFEENLPTSRVRGISETPEAFDAELWEGLVELGIPGALIPGEFGGSGLEMLDAALISESLGFAAVPAPFVGACVMAPAAFLAAGTPQQQREWLPEIASGRRIFGVAISETVSRREGAGVRFEAGRLHGKALFVLDSGQADVFLVAAGTTVLAVVPRDAPGLSVTPLRTIDATRRLSELDLAAVEPLTLVGGPRGAGVALGRMLDAGRIALAADTLGACDRALELAVEYAKVRKQFDRVIGSFQAVKHMCAEMAAAVEPARSLLWYAGYAYDHVPDESRETSSLAKAHLSEVGTSTLRTATEVHGGIGFTEEGDVHLWFKRVGLDRQLLGGPEQLRAAVARTTLRGPAEITLS